MWGNQKFWLDHLKVPGLSFFVVSIAFLIDNNISLFNFIAQVTIHLTCTNQRTSLPFGYINARSRIVGFFIHLIISQFLLVSIG
jgi:hypothetical protein